VPGTLRDSLILLALVLEQQTELQPTRIMTDTGAHSDVVFGSSGFSGIDSAGPLTQIRTVSQARQPRRRRLGEP